MFNLTTLFNITLGIALFIVIFFLSLLIYFFMLNPYDYKRSIVIVDEKKAIAYEADDVIKSIKGLMFLDDFDEILVFRFNRDKNRFWMWNVRFDIYAIGIKDGKVVDIKKLKAYDTKSVEIYGNIVLEMKEEKLKELGIEIGKEVLIKKE